MPSLFSDLCKTTVLHLDSRGGSRGGVRGARPPLNFTPNWDPKGPKKVFLRPTPLISGSGWPPAPSPYLKVWIHPWIGLELFCLWWNKNMQTCIILLCFKKNKRRTNCCFMEQENLLGKKLILWKQNSFLILKSNSKQIPKLNTR